MSTTTVMSGPQLVVPTAEEAISIANRWLHTDVAMLIHVSQATFMPENYWWHLPIQLSYPDTGPLGVIGDAYLHAGTGQFVARPTPEELLRRAELLADAHGFTAEADEA